MNNKVMAIIAGLLVICSAAGLGMYVRMECDESKRASDYTILDDLDSNIRKGLTMEVTAYYYAPTDSSYHGKLVIDYVSDEGCGFSQTTRTWCGIMLEYDHAFDYICALLGSDFTDTTGEENFTVIKVSDDGYITFKIRDKPGHGCDIDLTVRTVFENGAYEVVCVRGAYVTDDTAPSGTMMNSRYVFEDVDGEVSIDNTITIDESTGGISFDDLKKEVMDFMLKYPVEVKTVGKEGSEQLGNVECDTYLFDTEIEFAGSTLLSGMYYLYNDFAVKYIVDMVNISGEMFKWILLDIYFE